jgi:4-hydroxy-3-methylbut-2-enyl diphosphate reductase
LINNENEIRPEWLKEVKTIGLTAGASTPESIVQLCIQKLIELGVEAVEDVIFTQEDVVFQLPKPIVSALNGKKVDAIPGSTRCSHPVQRY